VSDGRRFGSLKLYTIRLSARITHRFIEMTSRNCSLLITFSQLLKALRSAKYLRVQGKVPTIEGENAGELLLPM
jgi:hypothetical protein